jgi:hypothetical protein
MGEHYMAIVGAGYALHFFWPETSLPDKKKGSSRDAKIFLVSTGYYPDRIIRSDSVKRIYF